MNAPLALSPLHDLLALHVPGADGGDAERAAVLGIADLSLLPRAGVKGRGAADWLADLGLALPTLTNSWISLPGNGLVARLGLTEYLVEGAAAARMQAARTTGVYPVLRQDASFALCGVRLNELLLQTCNVDFRVLDAEPGTVILTSMAGVGVTILSLGNGTYRLWCDGTYGLYLWETLVEIAREIGGGPIGTDALPPLTPTPANVFSEPLHDPC